MTKEDMTNIGTLTNKGLKKLISNEQKNFVPESISKKQMIELFLSGKIKTKDDNKIILEFYSSELPPITKKYVYNSKIDQYELKE